jgi:hypothetical protein
LRPRELIRIPLRLDTGPLFGVFSQVPQNDLFINFTATTNPVVVQSTDKKAPPQATTGACGNRVSISNLIERHPAPLTNQGQTQMAMDLSTGDAAARSRALQCMALVASQRNSPNLPQQTLTIANDFARKIRNETSDRDEAVRSWAKYLDVMSATTPTVQQTVTNLTHDSDWEARMLSLLAARVALGPKCADIVQSLNNDSDSLVAAFSKAISADLEHSATEPSIPDQSAPGLGASPGMNTSPGQGAPPALGTSPVLGSSPVLGTTPDLNQTSPATRPTTAP